jgi:6-phosphogluconolactonase
MNKRKILICDNINEASESVIEKWKQISRTAIKDKGYFSVALPGGNTPAHLYLQLSHIEDLDWERTHIFLGDERLVGSSYPDSNYFLIRENLIKKINIPKENIHLISEVNTPENIASLYEDDLKGFFKLKDGEFPRFDLILLGIGADGHTASLFPEHPALNECTRLVVPIEYKRVNFKRISLTLPVINNARNIIFLVLGALKAEAVREVLENEDSKMPAALVKPNEAEVVFILNKESGSLLSKNLKS